MKKTADNQKEDGCRNVMLLAMSTLPRGPEVNTYQDEEQKFCFKSLSQMEPHTKYVIAMLGQQGQRLDSIVILESEKAREERPDQWGGESATSLYRKRIYNYLGGTEEVGISILDPLEDLKETVPDLSLYSSTENFPKIYTVNLEDPVFFWKAVQKILGSDRKEKVHLYMDMQGGDRNAVSQMNAIAVLLSRQNVEIRGRFANNYEPKKEKPLHTIREASREYRTYDLISAMDIFARYGWGDKLEEYFGVNRQKDSKESRLVEAIKEASLAISRCNGDGFDRAVRKNESLQAEFENPETITEMDVVYQDIKENYAPLFGAKYRYVAQIRWCLDRSFLQQALTILEAKMPYEFVCSGLIYYKVKLEDKEKFFKKCEKLYFNLKEWDHYKMKDLNHYLIKDYSRCNHAPWFQDPEKLLVFGLGDARKKEVISLLGKYRQLCGMRNQMNHAAGEEHNPDGFFCWMREKYKDDPNWKKQKKRGYEKEIRNFLDQWEELAKSVPAKAREEAVDLS